MSPGALGFFSFLSPALLAPTAEQRESLLSLIQPLILRSQLKHLHWAAPQVPQVGQGTSALGSHDTLASLHYKNSYHIVLPVGH